MFTVALIGPDGAGKTTVGRRLEKYSALPVKYLYMGVNPDASNCALPTTRLVRAIKRLLGATPAGGPPDPRRPAVRPTRAMPRRVASVRSGLRLANRLAEEWFRQAVACYHKARGRVVLFDRHFFLDYHAYDIAGAGRGRPLTRRMHGLMLSRLYPKPDLVICLDAPAELLFARKREGTLEALELRRAQCLSARSLVPHFAVVHVEQPLDCVVHEVADIIGQFMVRKSNSAATTHGGGPSRSQSPPRPRPHPRMIHGRGGEGTAKGGDDAAGAAASACRGNGASNGRHERAILVTDAGRGSAIAMIRSLGRQGWRVIAADSSPRSLGFCSRYAQERLVYPPPETDPAGFVRTLADAARRGRIELIVPISDACLLPLAESRDRFEPSTRLAIPDPLGLAVTTNKLKTLDLAERLGVPTPRTRVVCTVDEARAASEWVGWPVVLKPQVSRLYRDRAGLEALTVSYAGTAQQLADGMRSFEGRCPVLLQEYYPGVGHGVELLLDRGRPLRAFQHKRLREIPLNGGASALRESVPLDPVLYRHSVRLLAALEWTGLAMVEFKLGADGPKLMEINGRVWGSLPLAVHSGVDFPAELAQLYLGGTVYAGPLARYRTGVRARNLELDVTWIASVLLGRRRYPFLAAPNRRAGLAALVGLLDPSCKFDVLCLDDPRPGLAEIPKIVRKFATKLAV